MFDDRSGPQIYDRQTALQLIALGHDWHAVQCWSGFGQADEGIAAVQGKTARHAREIGNGLDLTGFGTDH